MKTCQYRVRFPRFTGVEVERKLLYGYGDKLHVVKVESKVQCTLEISFPANQMARVSYVTKHKDGGGLELKFEFISTDAVSGSKATRTCGMQLTLIGSKDEPEPIIATLVDAPKSNKRTHVLLPKKDDPDNEKVEKVPPSE